MKQSTDYQVEDISQDCLQKYRLPGHSNEY